MRKGKQANSTIRVKSQSKAKTSATQRAYKNKLRRRSKIPLRTETASDENLCEVTKNQ